MQDAEERRRGLDEKRACREEGVGKGRILILEMLQDEQKEGNDRLGGCAAG